MFNLQKRSSFLALVLVLAMLFSLMPFATSAQPTAVAAEETVTPATLTPLQRQVGDSLTDDQRDVFIVCLDDAVLAREMRSAYREPQGLTTMALRQEKMHFAQDSRNYFMQQTVQALDIRGQVLSTYDLIFTGFAMEMTYAQAKALEQQPGVLFVEKNIVFTIPKHDFQVQGWSPEGQQIDQETAYDLGYKGTGRLCAVIDSGCDITHKDFVPPNTEGARFKDEAAIDAYKAANDIKRGYWHNAKIPFYYSYGMADPKKIDLGDKISDHGLHVAGTIGANGDPDHGGLRGVAPECQLAIMGVANSQGGLNGKAIMDALEDAIKLNCDSINMSLGSKLGFDDQDYKGYKKSLASARSAGIIVDIAAGNEGSSGFTNFTPNVADPDYEMLGSPAVFPDSFAVASINTTAMMQTILKAKSASGEEKTFIGNLILKEGVKAFPQDYLEFVDCGIGKDVPDTVKDKIALIQRGELTFTEKVANAAAKGAVAVILYNNQPGHVNPGGEFTLPVFNLSQADGEALKKNYTQACYGGEELASYPDAGEPSDFSSWGPTPYLNLKPEIMAPGGNVRSLGHKNTYINMSGTSMATPHMTGCSALLMERVKGSDKLNLSKNDAYLMTKNILMSTAVPVKTKEGLSYSPRKQGAGLVKLGPALKTNAIVVDADTNHPNSVGISKVNLGDKVGTTFTLNVEVNNFGTADLTFTPSMEVLTDKAGKLDFNSLTPQLIGSKDFEQVVIPAGTKKMLNFEFTISNDVDAHLLQEMPQGYWLDGFLRLKSSDPKTQPDIGLPFMGFKGEWNKVRAMEKFVYLMDTSKERPMYASLETKAKLEENDDGNNMTHLVTTIEGKSAVLGETTKAEDAIRSFDKDHLAISPNGDGQADYLQLRATYVRYHRGGKLEIVQNNKVLTTINGYDFGDKNYDGYKIDPKDKKTFRSNLSERIKWDGKKYSQDLPDGLYELRFKTDLKLDEKVWPSSYKNPQNFSEQTLKVYVDRVAPEAMNVQFANGQLTFKASDAEPSSGIRSVVVSGPNGEIKANDDGSYTIPDGVTADQINIDVTDNAYNTYSDTVAGATSGGPTGSIIIESKMKDGTGTPPTVAYQVLDQKGKVKSNLQKLPLGIYKVKINGKLPDGYSVDKTEQTVELTEAKKDVTVTFTYEKVEIGEAMIKLMVSVAGAETDLEDFTGSLSAISSSGLEYKFQKPYLNYYRVKAPYGQYKVKVSYDSNKYTGTDPVEPVIEINSKYASSFDASKIVLIAKTAPPVNLKVEGGEFIIGSGSERFSEKAIPPGTPITLYAKLPDKDSVFVNWTTEKDAVKIDISDTFNVDGLNATMGDKATTIKANFSPFYKGAYWRDGFEEWNYGSITGSKWTVVDKNQDKISWTSDSYLATNTAYAAQIKTYKLGSSYNFEDIPMDDWLISEAIEIKADTTLKLIANAMDRFDSGQKFEIRIGPATANISDPSETEFTLLKTCEIPTKNYQAWQHFEADLKDYAGQKMRIAIRCLQGNKSYYLILSALALFGADAPQPPQPTEYSIQVDSDASKGDVLVSAQKAAADTAITFTATPRDGYAIDQVSVQRQDGTPVEVSGGQTAIDRKTLELLQTLDRPIELQKAGESKQYSFTMPAANVTIKVTWKAVKPEPSKLTLTVIQTPSDLAKVSWTPQELKADEEVTLTLTPPADYVMDGEPLAMSDDLEMPELTRVDGAAGYQYKFQMTKSNLSIVVAWKKNSPTPPPTPTTYSVTVTQSEGEHGTAVAKPSQDLHKGDKVFLTVKANEGYQLKALPIVKDSKNTAITVTETDDSPLADGSRKFLFLMPADNVTANVLWESVTPPVTPGKIIVVIEDKTLISDVKVGEVKKDGKAYTVPEGAELKFDITPLSADQAKELKVPETDKAKVEGEGKETLWLDIQTLYKGANDNDFVKIEGISANMVVSAAEGKLNTHDVTVYVANDQTMALTKCESTTVGNAIHFFGPHFSYYALVFTAKAEPTPEPQPEPQPQPEPPAKTQPVVISGPGYHRNPNLTPQVVEPQADKQGNANNAAANAAADTAKPSQHLPKTGAVDTLPYALLALAAAALLLWKRR